MEGTELPDLAAAKRKALERIRGLLHEEAGNGPPDLNRYVEITDEAGVLVAIVHFREVLD